eukprot:scaffold40995_cov39-Tisochrysis_lutea.AAC.4
MRHEQVSLRRLQASSRAQYAPVYAFGSHPPLQQSGCTCTPCANYGNAASCVLMVDPKAESNKRIKSGNCGLSASYSSPHADSNGSISQIGHHTPLFLSGNLSCMRYRTRHTTMTPHTQPCSQSTQKSIRRACTYKTTFLTSMTAMRVSAQGTTHTTQKDGHATETSSNVGPHAQYTARMIRRSLACHNTVRVSH